MRTVNALRLHDPSKRQQAAFDELAEQFDSVRLERHLASPTSYRATCFDNCGCAGGEVSDDVECPKCRGRGRRKRAVYVVFLDGTKRRED